MPHKKRKVKKEKNYTIVYLLVITAIILGLFVFKRPFITGKVIQGKETVYSENLNIKKNESGNYTWNVKNPGNIKSLKTTGSVTSNGTAKVYIEKNGTKYLLFDSTKQLFDVDVHVLPEYKKIFPGDEMLIQITLLNLRGFGAGNVNVKYSIKDKKGNLIASEREPVYVETQAKFIRKLIIPAEIVPGTYVAFVEASTDVIVGTGSDTFEVMSKYEYKNPPELRYYIIGLAVLVALVIIFILAIQGFRVLKKKKEIIKLKQELPMERIGKLEKELNALEEARKSGFISEDSYQKEKKRLEERLGVSKK